MAFLQQLGTLLRGKANDLLQKQIDANSITMVREYIRELEDAIDKMRQEAISHAGAVRTNKRETLELSAQIKTVEKTIQSLVENGHQELARPKAAELVRLRKNYDEHIEAASTITKESQEADSIVAQMENKHAEMADQLHKLEHLDADTKAKTASAHAMAHFSRLVNSNISGASLDNTAEKLKQQHDHAEEEFSRAMDGAQIHEDPNTTAAVDDVLAEFAKSVPFKTKSAS